MPSKRPVSAAVPRVVRTVEGIPPAAVPPAEPRDLMGELTALADAFYRVVEYLRAPDPPITESEAAEIADAALFRAEEVLDRGREPSVSPAEPPEAKRELTEYEKGYLDGVLAYSYRSDGEVYVGKNRLTTYKAAALGFLRKQGIDTKGWDVNVR